MQALMELYYIKASADPATAGKLEEWIKRNIKEHSVTVKQSEMIAVDGEHAHHNIRRGVEKLGIALVDHFNPYPRFEKDERTGHLTCKLVALTLKNDYGK